MNGNIPGWDFNGLSPFSWLAARNVLHPELSPKESEDDSYVDELWYGEEPDVTRENDPRFQ